LVGRLRLAEYDGIMAHRAALFNRYRQALPELQFQLRAPGSQAHQFVPALLPSAIAGRKTAIRAELADQGIGTGTYFSPHLMEQSYFQKVCVGGALPVSDDVSARMMSLPLFDTMTLDEVDQVAECLRPLIAVTGPRRRGRKPAHSEQHLPMVYGDTSRAIGEVAVK
jgi:dTDP-4-amino-4,6-dideoxygalactose transaminase